MRPPPCANPLSVGIAAVRKAAFGAGARVLIAGAGPIGIVIAQLARAYGQVTEIVEAILDAPRQSGAELRRHW